MNAPELFELAVNTLRRQYSDHRFFKERDIAWTVQKQILSEVERRGLKYLVADNYKVGTFFADLVILNGDLVEVIAEFKYEPSSDRATNRGGDIPSSKLPVVADWKEVEKDVERVQNYVRLKQSRAAYSVLIDEGGRHNWRCPPDGCKWIPWDRDICVLWSQHHQDST